MTRLRIFFGDLTHDTVGFATEVFPLNVGFIVAYYKKRFGDDVGVKIFKYIENSNRRSTPTLWTFLPLATTRDAA